MRITQILDLGASSGASHGIVSWALGASGRPYIRRSTYEKWVRHCKRENSYG